MVNSPDNSNSGSGDGTVRERLLDAAEELFCEHSFEGTSIRDIAAAANCNIASVNYYFGGKENLYVELWRRHHTQIVGVRIESINEVMAKTGGKPDLEVLLKSFAEAFLGPLMDSNKGPRLMKLMAREMIDRNLPKDMFGKEVIRPTMTAMQDALSKACPALEQSKIPLVVFSLVSQLLHTILIKAIHQGIDDQELAQFDPVMVINHVVAFTAAGIRAYAKEQGK